MKNIFKNGLSKSVLVIIIITWVWVYFNNHLWRGDHIVWDIVQYYEYLPTTFIYKDLSLHYADEDPGFFRYRVWYTVAPNGGRVIQATYGMSLLYSPFFFIGHVAAGLFHQPQTGYSIPYQSALISGCLFYLLAGFFFLRKALLFFFSDAITALVITCIYFGTNLFYYSSFNALMPHTYIFSFSCVFIYLTVIWHKKKSHLVSALLGIVLGIMTLIRPTLIVMTLVFLFYGLYNKKTFLDKTELFWQEKWKIVLIILFSCLMILPQLMYWKYISGDWLFYSYRDQGFYFSTPHIIDGLFSYRKGWLLYTPLMSLAILGFFFLFKSIKEMFFPMLFIFLLSSYLILSWWCWWYGGSFGLRAFIDFYGLLAFPMGAFFQTMLTKRDIRVIILELTLFFIVLNLFQTWQFKRALIHHDCMTKEAYWLNFGRQTCAHDWWETLKAPNYDKALRGEKEE